MGQYQIVVLSVGILYALFMFFVKLVFLVFVLLKTNNSDNTTELPKLNAVITA